MTFEESMFRAGREILDLIGETAASKFLEGEGEPIQGRITSRSAGGLKGSYLGGSASIRKISVEQDKATFEIGSDLPYAALIELGGVRVVTERMRKFFWAKYFTTPEGDPKRIMWSRMRFSNVIRFKPRPTLKPSAEEVIQSGLPEILSKYTMEYLRVSIKELITGNARAVPLSAIK